MKHYRFTEHRQVMVTVPDDTKEEDIKKLFEERKNNTKFKYTIKEVKTTMKEVKVKSKAYKLTELDKSFADQYKVSSSYISLNDIYARYMRATFEQEENAGKRNIKNLFSDNFESEYIINILLPNGKRTSRKVYYCKLK